MYVCVCASSYGESVSKHTSVVRQGLACASGREARENANCYFQVFNLILFLFATQKGNTSEAAGPTGAIGESARLGQCRSLI